MNNSKYITVMAQGYYGYNVITKIKNENIDKFILGIHEDNYPEYLMKDKKIDRSIIEVPDTDNLVIVYNKYKEEKNVKENMKRSAIIPELDISLHSKCIACRIDKNGNLESLQPEDVDTILKYFPRRPM